jgi:hypothetical protein
VREDNIAKNIAKTVFGCGCTAWLIGVLINIALVGAVIYVAIHFIGKFW